MDVSWRTILGSPLSRGWHRKDSIKFDKIECSLPIVKCTYPWNFTSILAFGWSVTTDDQPDRSSFWLFLHPPSHMMHLFWTYYKEEFYRWYNSMTHTRKDFKCYPTTAQYSTVEACIDWSGMRVEDTAAAEVLYFTAGHGVLLSERPSYI